jgi:hypothetical protein
MGDGEDVLVDRRNRRLSKDSEKLTATSEVFVYVALMRLMARPLARL